MKNITYKTQLLLASVVIALAMIGAALYIRTHDTNKDQAATNSAKDNSSKVTPPPVTDTTTPVPVNESPITN